MLIVGTDCKSALSDGTLEIAGVLAAPFTEGASLSVSALGTEISAFGHVGNSVLDVIDYSQETLTLDKMVYRQAKFFASAGAGKAVEKITQKNAQYIIRSVKTFSENYVLPILENQWNRLKI